MPIVEGQITDQARAHAISPQEIAEQIMLGPDGIKRLLERER